MINLRLVFLLATSILSLGASECLSSSSRVSGIAPANHLWSGAKQDGTDQVASPQTTPDSRSKTISGVVVAYDDGVEIGDGSCRQTFIVRVQEPDEYHRSSNYIILRYAGSCLKLTLEDTLRVERQRNFEVKRDLSCAQRLSELQYFESLYPTGAVVRTPRLKPVPGKEKEPIPTAAKLPCYVLTSPFETNNLSND